MTKISKTFATKAIFKMDIKLFKNQLDHLLTKRVDFLTTSVFHFAKETGIKR